MYRRIAALAFMANLSGKDIPQLVQELAKLAHKFDSAGFRSPARSYRKTAALAFMGLFSKEIPQIKQVGKLSPASLCRGELYQLLRRIFREKKFLSLHESLPLILINEIQ